VKKRFKFGERRLIGEGGIEQGLINFGRENWGGECRRVPFDEAIKGGEGPDAFYRKPGVWGGMGGRGAHCVKRKKKGVTLSKG